VKLGPEQPGAAHEGVQHEVAHFLGQAGTSVTSHRGTTFSSFLSLAISTRRCLTLPQQFWSLDEEQQPLPPKRLPNQQHGGTQKSSQATPQAG
jgi:hypothetical protein